MWKKAFAVLLTLNLLIIAGGGILFAALPKTNSGVSPKPVALSNQAAHIQVSIGDQAINTYLQYFLADQTDLKGVLSYASVQFGDQWDVKLGALLSDRIVPFDVTFTPVISGGNLHLRMESATVADVAVPPGVLFLAFRHIPWPNWIHVDPANETLDLNFTERPQHPYGIQVLKYSPQTKMLTLLISILPKDTFSHGSTSSSGGSSSSNSPATG